MKKAIVFILFPFLALGQDDNFILLDNNEKIVGHQIEYKAPLFVKPYLLVDGTKKYNLSTEVQAYQLNGTYYKKLIVTPYSKPTFYIRTAHGKIDAYTKTSSTTQWNGGAMSTISNRWDYYSINNASVKKLRFRNIKKDLKGSSVAMKIIKEIKNLRVVSGIGYIGGTALIVGGVAASVNSTDEGNHGFPPSVIIGAVVFNINLFLLDHKRNKMIESIKAYNKEME
jgi:hypothetical protein